MVLPFWSVSPKGPPIAAVGFASGAGPRPVTSSTTAKHSMRPARNAERISSRRVVRGFIRLLNSKTRCDAGRDDLEESRRPVMSPENQRRGDQQAADPADQQDRQRSETGRMNR